MLLNLKTIHTPATLDEAVALLRQPATYPLYGGAALQRASRPDVAAAVNLDRLGLDYARLSENSLRLGTMLTLEQARRACLEHGAAHPRIAAVADLLEQEMPETLRHTLTLGDLLMERDPQSRTLTLLLALGAVLKRVDLDMHFTVSAWFSLPGDVARQLIAHVRIPRGPSRAGVAYEQVARTPADAPIVGAVACVEVPEGSARHTTLALCGAAPTPVPQPEVARLVDETGDLDAALDQLALNPVGDHWGSVEYRAAMARVVAGRALRRALGAVQ